MKIPSPSIPTRLITRAREEKRQKREKKRERETENSKSTRNREEPSWFSLVTRAFFHFGGGGGREGRSDNSVFVFAGLPAPWKPGGGEEEEEEERKSARRFAAERQGNCAASKAQWFRCGAATRCVFQLFLIIFWKPRPRLMHTPPPLC